MGINRNQAYRKRIAQSFSDGDVASCYVYRPPYPGELFTHLDSIVAERKRALDIGSGPGKIARVLADSFKQVVAVEPSDAMIKVGKFIDSGVHSNLEWVRMHAEDYEDEGRFDLITAGSSIHWLDHSIIFPKLRIWTDTVAVISGDAPEEPPCGKQLWAEFVTKWLSRLVKKDPEKWAEYDPAGFKDEANRHEKWIDIAGRKEFINFIEQPLEEFVESQHSRATWARNAMGKTLSDEFDRELIALMNPFAENGKLYLNIPFSVTWGRPRSFPLDRKEETDR